ncbi:MAG: thioesterase family protein [Zavarzinia sp.]|nr:thioesterase family protein [Zavarzinia sp.]
MTSFTEFLAALAPVEGGLGVTATDDWLQGRTLYGGASAALCLETALRAIDDLPPLRSAQFAFVGPATGALEMRPVVLRRGKSTAFVGVDLAGDAGIATRALLCFGAARQSAVAFDGLPMPEAPDPATCTDFFRGGMRPNFAHQFEMVDAGGGIPFSMGETPEYRLWLRHKDRAAAADMTALVALADAPPPAAMVRFPSFGPISTVTWSMEILNDPPAGGEGWCLMVSRAETMADGYSSQAMSLWAADGTPLMAARQSVAIFV